MLCNDLRTSGQKFLGRRIIEIMGHLVKPFSTGDAARRLMTNQQTLIGMNRLELVELRKYQLNAYSHRMPLKEDPEATL